ncbi:MAG TPA: hypothetical protein VHG51_20720, partial [Longimicrobiaceae bacterium]|nr:hypothetical protein [Longimicrobiaceae bacterium]
RLRGSGRAATAGRGASVSVALSGGAPGITYDGAVRLGVCARVGPTVAPLHPVSADSLGRGAAASDLPFPVDSLLRAPHVVVYGRGGRPEACGPVGAPAARDTAAPPPPDTAGPRAED